MTCLWQHWEMDGLDTPQTLPKRAESFEEDVEKGCALVYIEADLLRA